MSKNFRSVLMMFITLCLMLLPAIYSAVKAQPAAPTVTLSKPTGSLTPVIPRTERSTTTYTGSGRVVDVLHYSDQPYACEFHVLQDDSKLIRALVGPFTTIDIDANDYLFRYAKASLLCGMAANAFSMEKRVTVAGNITLETSGPFDHGFMMVTSMKYNSEIITTSGGRDPLELACAIRGECSGSAMVGQVQVFGITNNRICEAQLYQRREATIKESTLSVRLDPTTVESYKMVSAVNDRIKLCQTLIGGSDTNMPVEFWAYQEGSPRVLFIGNAPRYMHLNNGFTVSGYDDMAF